MPLRKKLDTRIKTLIDNGRANNHRSFLVIVGDKGKDQVRMLLLYVSHSEVINLHHMLTKSTVGTQPSVLWCYKKDLGFTTYFLSSGTAIHTFRHRQKRIKQIKRKQRQGLLDPNKEDAFELFLTTANVRWTYYKDSHKILGNTYGMCVLQVWLQRISISLISSVPLLAPRSFFLRFHSFPIPDPFRHPVSHTILVGLRSDNAEHSGPYDRDRTRRRPCHLASTHNAVAEAVVFLIHGYA
jgi:hypothetical protein